MSFLALDFETATSEPTSACEIGVALVEGGRVTSSAGWLIKPPQWPYFQAMNVQVHGIRPADVAQSPTFAALWPELQRWFAAAPTLIAHNAAFDMKVLRASLAHSKLPVPNTQYACSVQFARRVWPHFPNHKLNSLCAQHGINLKNHHRAEADARACAEITLRALADTQSRTFAEFAASHPVNVKPLVV
jgi:DNA polymerase III subunit epsilon